MKSIIHIDQHALKRNRKSGSREPVITVKTYKTNLRAHSVSIAGPARLVYSPDKPLSCGATVWIETSGNVTIP
jgi:hypothetical protein